GVRVGAASVVDVAERAAGLDSRSGDAEFGDAPQLARRVTTARPARVIGHADSEATAFGEALDEALRADRRVSGEARRRPVATPRVEAENRRRDRAHETGAVERIAQELRTGPLVRLRSEEHTSELQS